MLPVSFIRSCLYRSPPTRRRITFPDLDSDENDVYGETSAVERYWIGGSADRIGVNPPWVQRVDLVVGILRQRVW